MTEKQIKIQESLEMLAKIGGTVNTIKQNAKDQREYDSAVYLLKLLKVVNSELSSLDESKKPVQESSGFNPMSAKAAPMREQGPDPIFGDMDMYDSAGDSNNGGGLWKEALNYGVKEGGLRFNSNSFGEA